MVSRRILNIPPLLPVYLYFADAVHWGFGADLARCKYLSSVGPYVLNPQINQFGVQASACSLLVLFGLSSYFPGLSVYRWSEHMITIIDPSGSPPAWLVICVPDVCSCRLPVAVHEGNPSAGKNHDRSTGQKLDQVLHSVSLSPLISHAATLFSTGPASLTNS